MHGVDLHDEKIEIIHGRPVAMAGASIEHDIVSGNIFFGFKNFLKGNICKVFGSNVLVVLNENIKYYPDISVVCDRNKITKMHIVGAPDFVIEILSPSTAKNDKSIKFVDYAKAGVRELWLVDIGNRAVEVYSLNGDVFVMSHYCANVSDEELAIATEIAKESLVRDNVKSNIFPGLILPLFEVFMDLD